MASVVSDNAWLQGGTKAVRLADGVSRRPASKSVPEGARPVDRVAGANEATGDDDGSAPDAGPVPAIVRRYGQGRLLGRRKTRYYF